MTGRTALDSNSIIADLRDGDVPTLPSGPDAIIPLPVLGELFAGAYSSKQRDANVTSIDKFIATRTVLAPDAATARDYGILRSRFVTKLSIAKVNDLWIAALCLQHNLPLLTNDRGFDSIAELTVIHW
ncbi:MAG TPA: PIN domain-containing protein [Thermoanaerobaculia bacterium]